VQTNQKIIKDFVVMNFKILKNHILDQSSDLKL